MTAASYSTRPFAPLSRPSIRWTRFLALLGVCLPVPICAVSGLSLPLPATVERIAASLVPWAGGVTMSGNEALQTGEDGSIVAGTDERSGDGAAHLVGVVSTLGTRTKDGGRLVVPRPGAGVVPPARGIPTVPGSLAPAAPDQGTGRAQPANGGDSTPSAPSTPSESPTPAPGPAPTTPTEPAPPPVQSDPDPVAAVKPVVDEVLAPVAPIVEDTVNTVEETISPVVPVLPGLGK
jgi:hypothetical protein